MKIKTIATGSEGNGYLLKREGLFLLLEAGAPLNRVRQLSDYNLDRITACLISHEHRDHCRYYKEYLDRDIDIYASQGTAEALGDKRIKIIKSAPDGHFAGAFNFTSFSLNHDATDPVGFFITYSENKSLLYATDTGYIEQVPRGLSILMIECNYTRKRIKNNMHDKDLGMSVPQKMRVHEHHLGLEDVMLYLERIDTSHLEEIHLIHLSSRNSEPEMMVRKIQNLTGCPTYIAGEGGE